MNDGSLTCRRNPSRGADSQKPAWHLALAAVWIDDKCLQKEPWRNSITPSFPKAGPSHTQSLHPGDSMWACPPFSLNPPEQAVLCVVPALFCGLWPASLGLLGLWLLAGFCPWEALTGGQGAVRKREGTSSLLLSAMKPLLQKLCPSTNVGPGQLLPHSWLSPSQGTRLPPFGPLAVKWKCLSTVNSLAASPPLLDPCELEPCPQLCSDACTQVSPLNHLRWTLLPTRALAAAPSLGYQRGREQVSFMRTSHLHLNEETTYMWGLVMKEVSLGCAILLRRGLTTFRMWWLELWSV